MEKIRLKNGQEFNLVPDGIRPSEKRRSFTISGSSYAEIENAFTENNLDRVEHVSDSGEILSTYLDCVKAVAIYKNIENGTYTVEVSVDAIEKALKQLAESQTNAELALVEVYEMFLGVMMNG